MQWARASLVGLLAIWANGATADPPAARDLRPSLEAIRQVDRLGDGHDRAIAAAAELGRLGPERLPELLAGMNGANPLATNWLRGIVEAVADRATRGGQPLPADALEAFLLEVSNSPRARRLAYELLLVAEPNAGERLIPRMLDDPSVELRREAVVWAIGQAERAETSGAGADDVLAAYRRAFAASRDLDQIKQLAEKLEKLGAKPDLPRHLGFVTRWQLIGPFDNSGKRGFPVAYPPEVEPFSADAEYPGKGKTVRWIEHVTSDDFGVVDLNKALGKEPGAIAYARAEFVCDAERPVELRLGCINANKVWLNGRPVAVHEVYHSGTDIDQYVEPVTLEPGRNVILLKVAQNEQTEAWAQDWAFQLRVCDAVGTAVESAANPPEAAGR